MSIAPTQDQLLKLASDLHAHPDLLLLRGFLAGASGSGKSSTGAVMVEEASRLGVNSLIIAPTDDWYGIGASADESGPGLDHVQFGGEFGDLPLSSEMGSAIARQVADGMPALCVIDRLSLDDRATFVADCCDTLLELNRSPLLLLIDEAHLLAPGRSVGKSSERARCRDSIVSVVTTGRKPAQIGTWLITQRLARLHTDARELADVSIIHKLRGGNDQAAAAVWVEGHLPDPAEFKRVGKLERGEAFVVAPDYEIAGVYRIRMKQTFDSSASGSVLATVDRRPPRGRSHVDLDAVKAAIGSAVEAVQENDPDALKRRVRDLEQQLAAAPANAPAAAALNAAYEAGSKDASSGHEAALRGERQTFVSHLMDIQGATRGALSQARVTHDHVARVRELYEPRMEDEPDPAPIDPYNADDGRAQAQVHARADAARLQRELAAVRGKQIGELSLGPAGGTVEPSGDAPAKLKAGAIRMLQVLRAYNTARPDGLTRFDLGCLALVAQGGTMSNYLTTLRSQRLLIEDGALIRLSEKGMACTTPAAPFTPEQVVDLHRGKLKAGALRMLSILMRMHPDGCTRSELSRLGGVAQGGTLSNYMSSLRKRGLVTERSRRVYAGNILYIGGEA